MFFIFLFILLCILVFILSLIFSKIEVNIKKFDLMLSDNSNDKKKFKYYIEIAPLLFYRIKIFKIKINNENFEKWKLRLKKIADNRIINNNNFLDFKNVFKVIKDLGFKFKIIKIKIQFGLENASSTAIITGIVSMLLALITNNCKEKNINVLPIYNNKNILKINFNCIFYINVIHYIYMKIVKERRKVNERKSSYRRSYAYNNE